MDAKAEAEERYPWPNGLSFAWVEEEKQHAFLAGAAWALREFGYVLTREGWSHSPTWFAAEAHRIADGIEKVS